MIARTFALALPLVGLGCAPSTTPTSPASGSSVVVDVNAPAPPPAPAPTSEPPPASTAAAETKPPEPPSAPEPVELAPGSKPTSGVHTMGVLGQGTGSLQDSSHAAGASGLTSIWGDPVGGSLSASSLSGMGGFGLGTLGSGSAKGQGSPPQIRPGDASIKGRLPPEVVRRIVRQNFGRFRMCYDDALRRNPKAGGRVGVRFVIDQDGAVDSTAAAPGTTVADKTMVACLLRSFGSLSFPNPEGGDKVVVVYPLQFSPGTPPAKTPAKAPAKP